MSKDPWCFSTQDYWCNRPYTCRVDNCEKELLELVFKDKFDKLEKIQNDDGIHLQLDGMIIYTTEIKNNLLYVSGGCGDQSIRSVDDKYFWDNLKIIINDTEEFMFNDWGKYE